MIILLLYGYDSGGRYAPHVVEQQPPPGANMTLVPVRIDIVLKDGSHGKRHGVFLGYANGLNVGVSVIAHEYERRSIHFDLSAH